MPVYAATRATEILGAVLKHGIKVVADDLSEDQWWKSATRGLKYIRKASRLCAIACPGFTSATSTVRQHGWWLLIQAFI